MVAVCFSFVSDISNLCEDTPFIGAVRVVVMVLFLDKVSILRFTCGMFGCQSLIPFLSKLFM